MIITEIEKLRMMIAENNPESYSYLVETLAKCSTDEDRKAVNELAQELMKDTAKSLKELNEKIDEFTMKEQLGELYEAVNFAYIARHYFGKTKSWLYHKIKGNTVNGKPAGFTTDEEVKFKTALIDLSVSLATFATKG